MEDVQPSQQGVKKMRQILLSYGQTSWYVQRPHVPQCVPSGSRMDQKIQVKGKGRWQKLAREAARPVPGTVTLGTGSVPGLRTHLYPTCE